MAPYLSVVKTRNKVSVLVKICGDLDRKCTPGTGSMSTDSLAGGTIAAITHRTEKSGHNMDQPASRGLEKNVVARFQAFLLWLTVFATSRCLGVPQHHLRVLLRESALEHPTILPCFTLRQQFLPTPLPFKGKTLKSTRRVFRKLWFSSSPSTDSRPNSSDTTISSRESCSCMQRTRSDEQATPKSG